MTARFQETRWSLVQQAQTATPESRAALSDLCAVYYAPVLAFTQACCREDGVARDLTHGFFERLLQGPGLSGAEPSRGRFRSFMLGAVKHYLGEQLTRQRAQKRGGRAEHITLDDTASLADPSALPPDRLFDRQWACTLLDHTLERLRLEQQAAGRAAVWPILMPCLAGQGSHGDTAQAAAQLGISQTAVRVHLHRLRKRWRELLHVELSQTLDAGEDTAAEMRHLLGALR